VTTGEPEEVGRDDVEALLETRRELGPSYDAALVDSFAERVQHAIAQRVDAEVASRDAARSAQAGAGGRQLALGIVSMVAAIPISIVLGLNSWPAMVVAWIGIVLVNMAHAIQSRPR
jgi:hypothetical protein